MLELVLFSLSFREASPVVGTSALPSPVANSARCCRLWVAVDTICWFSIFGAVEPLADCFCRIMSLIEGFQLDCAIRFSCSVFKPFSASSFVLGYFINSRSVNAAIIVA